MKYTEKQTLAEKTAQNLLEMIQEKGYGAGDKLPTEAELVETLGVGRNTVPGGPAYPYVPEYRYHPSGLRNLYFRQKRGGR